MKLACVALFMVGFITAAPATEPTKSKPAPTAKKVEPVTIPAGAVEVEPYTYRYTDTAGKSWLYRKTPFGVTRMEDKPGSTDATQRAQDLKTRLIDSTTATEHGESVRFERVWPFGKTQWERKKTELNEVERAVWNRELEKRAGRENTSVARENAAKD
ncbi:MAG TPA: hypothetical protein VLX58_14090 [Bryobacteraceae bacterium]|nr:hypothetical protein [Bryobacteraceae bacterium]